MACCILAISHPDTHTFNNIAARHTVPIYITRLRFVLQVDCVMLNNSSRKSLSVIALIRFPRRAFFSFLDGIALNLFFYCFGMNVFYSGKKYTEKMWFKSVTLLLSFYLVLTCARFVRFGSVVAQAVPVSVFLLAISGVFIT